MGGATEGADGPDGELEPAGTSIPRVALAGVAGVVVTVLATVLLAVTSPWLLPVAVVGGTAVAGYLARVGRLGATLLGALVMAAVGTATLAALWLVTTADPPRTGGASLGLVVGFLFVAFFVLVGMVLGGLGGLTGAVARQRRAATDAPAGDGATAAEGGAAHVDRDPGRPAPAAARGAGPTADSTTPGEASPGREGTSTSNVVVGAGLALATCFVPFAPAGAGFVTGYLEAAGPRHGAATGAVAGLVATVLLLGGLLLFAVLPLNIFRPFIFQYFPGLTVVLGGYVAGLAAIGGAFGGSLSSEA